MQIVRTIVWVLLLVGLFAFSAYNWNPVEVTLWGDLVLETKVPALVIIAFLIGLVPMWLLHRGVKWRLDRRIQTLENAARSAALARHEPAQTPTPAPSASTEKADAPTTTKDENLSPN